MLLNDMKSPCVFCRQGKTNKIGQSSVIDSVANKNPLFSNDDAKVLLFCRFKVMLEPWPDFTNMKDSMKI